MLSYCRPRRHCPCERTSPGGAGWGEMLHEAGPHSPGAPQVPPSATGGERQSRGCDPLQTPGLCAPFRLRGATCPSLCAGTLPPHLRQRPKKRCRSNLRRAEPRSPPRDKRRHAEPSCRTMSPGRIPNLTAGQAPRDTRPGTPPEMLPWLRFLPIADR